MLIKSFHYTIVSTTSDHHDLLQLHNLVQEKDSYIAQLNCKLLTVIFKREERCITATQDSQLSTTLTQDFSQGYRY